MNEREVIELLKHNRHQFANDLQLMLSYAQMGKLEVVQEKANEIIEITQRNHKFHNMPLPKTIITLMQLNNKKSGLEWTPLAELNENKPAVDDSKLAHVIKSIHQLITGHAMNLSLYHGTMTFQQKKSEPFKLLLICQGNFQNIDQLKAALLKMDRIEIERATNEELVFYWTAQN